MSELPQVLRREEFSLAEQKQGIAESALRTQFPALKPRAMFGPLRQYLEQSFRRRSFSLLDLGCGRGTLCFSLRRNCRYIGADRSPSAVETARRRFPARLFVRTDLSSFLPHLVLSERSFDVIVVSTFFSRYCGGAVSSRVPIPLLRFCSESLLRPGGSLVLVERCTPGREEEARWTFRMLRHLSQGLGLREVAAEASAAACTLISVKPR